MTASHMETSEVTDQIDPARIGAFFDLDQTLVRGASAYWAAKEMFRRSFFGGRDLLFAGRQTLRYVLFGEKSEAGVAHISNRAAEIVAGNFLEDVERLGEDLYEKYFVPKVYRTTYDLLKNHVDAGHSVYLVSATPWVIAEEFARRLGAAGGIGTKIKVREGRLVGEVDGRIVHGAAKVDAVKEVAAERDLDLEASWAYSDSANDIPMLSLVGNPVAVNPDRRLRAYARTQGWSTLRAYETKDIVKRWVTRAAFATLTAGTAYVLWEAVRPAAPPSSEGSLKAGDFAAKE